MTVFVLNVRPHVCCASISPVNSADNQYVIVITILLIHSCGPKRIANYFCQDLFKVTVVTALSVIVGLAECYPHAHFRGSIITLDLCTSSSSMDSRLASCGCALTGYIFKTPLTEVGPWLNQG